MKKLSVRISLENPCNEDWSLMTPVDQGRFCSNCKKTVVDMTSWTERDFVSYFNANPGGTCGRFHGHQLNRRFNDVVHVRKTTTGYRKAIALVVSFFALQAASAQQRERPATVQGVAPSNRSDGFHITGTVTDADSSPLRDVLIDYDGKTYRSDASGTFEIPAGATTGNLVFSHEGLVNEVRSYHPAMGAARYDVRLQKPSAVRFYGGAPMIHFYLPEDANFVTVAGRSLDSATKNFLANIAAMMQARPSSRVVLQTYSGKDPMPGVRRALLVQKYFSEKLYIDAERFLVSEPKRAKTAAERNRVYFQSWGE